MLTYNTEMEEVVSAQQSTFSMDGANVDQPMLEIMVRNMTMPDKDKITTRNSSSGSTLTQQMKKAWAVQEQYLLWIMQMALVMLPPISNLLEKIQLPELFLGKPHSPFTETTTIRDASFKVKTTAPCTNLLNLLHNRFHATAVLPQSMANVLNYVGMATWLMNVMKNLFVTKDMSWFSAMVVWKS